MKFQSISVLSEWGLVFAISLIVWLWPSAELANAFYTYAKSNFTTTHWGSTNVWPLACGIAWSAGLAWGAREEFSRAARRAVFTIPIVVAIGLLFPAIGSVLMAAVPLSFPSPMHAPLTLIVFFSEIPIAAFLLYRCIEHRQDERILLKALKVLSVSLAGLTVVKVAALVMLPGISVRFA